MYGRKGRCLWYGVLAWMGDAKGNGEGDVLKISPRLLLFDQTGLGGN